MPTLIQILVYTACASWLVCLTWYSVRAKWWRWREGRNIWGVALALTAVLALIAAQRIWPDYWLRPWLQVIVYGALTILAIQRTVQIELAQRRHRD